MKAVPDAKKKKEEEEEELDIDGLLDELKQHIIGIYNHLPPEERKNA